MSWQSRIISGPLRYLLKPFLKHVFDPRHAAQVDLLPYVLRHPPYLRYWHRPGGLTWINTGPCLPNAAILYFHGGAYISGSVEGYLGPLGLLSQMTGVEVCAVSYRLAPEHRFPAAFEDARAAWDRLADLGYRPQDIVLGGDSAGGGLAMALLAALCEEGTPPAAAFAFSPWTDLALTGESLELNAEVDPVLPVTRMAEVVELYLGDHDPRDPHASPLYATYPGCPPVFLQYGEHEILRDDSRRLADRLRDFGGVVSEDVVPEMPHVWQLFDGYLPEARESLVRTAEFVQASFADRSR